MGSSFIKNNSAAQEEPIDSQDTEVSPNGQEQHKRTKRKKASRACFHCQKAHLTCDDCMARDPTRKVI